MVWPFVIAAIAAIGAIAWISSELPDDLGDDGDGRGRTVNKASAVEPIPVVYGLRRIAGTRVFLVTGGPDNKYLWLAIALCEGDISAVRQVWIDGKPISAYDAVFAQGHSASAPAADRLAVVHWYRGTAGQSASALLRQAPGWTAAHRLRGVAYLACRFRHAADVWRGVPRVEALVEGRKIRDPRDGAVRFSTNAALVVRDYLTHPIYGGGRPAAEIDDDAIKASASDADAAQTYLAGAALPATSQIVQVGQCCRVTWLGAAPAGLRSGAVARWRNPDDGSTDTAPILSVDRVDEALELTGETGDEIGERWRWAALETASRRAEAVIQVSSRDSAGFRAEMAAGRVSVSASGRHEINAVIDTGEPLIDNVRALLSGCRGMLPWIGGKYTFLIERDRSPVMDIGPGQLVGPVASAGPKKRDLVNRASAIYVDPARDWKETEAIWPPAGGAVDRAMLALDGGERLSRDIRLPTVVSRPQALDLARIVTLRLRSGRRSQARGTPALLPVTPGNVVRVTDATLGWVNKPQLVLGVAHQYGGEIGLALVDHDASVYDWESADLLALHDDTSHRNPLIVPAMAGLTVAVVLDRVGGESDGDPVQWLIGAAATWDAPAAADVVESWISWRTSAVPGGAAAGEWETKVAPAGAGGADILPLRKDVKYDFRGLHRNAYGARSPWSAIVSQLIDKDITAPAAPTGLTLTGGVGLLSAAWTPPASAGFSHVEWELRRFDGENNVVETISGKYWGDSATAGGLPGKTRYDLRMRSVDDAGNKSVWTARVTATTLEAGTGPAGPGFQLIFAAAAAGAAAPALRATSQANRANDDYIPAGWSRNPPARTAAKPAIWYSIRYGSAGDWQEFLPAAEWSRDGRDGASIQYIFLATDDPRPPARPAYPAAERRKSGEYIPPNWLDDPPAPTASKRYVWTAISHKSLGAALWSQFSVVRRWDEFVTPDGVPTPEVFSGRGLPPVAEGGEGDTWLSIAGGAIAEVWGKIDSKWTRLSGSPLSARWSSGSGPPAAGSGVAGHYYADEDTANVYIRHGGGWHWAIDLDPGGAVTWLFDDDPPGSSAGANGNRAYDWSTGLAYEKRSGSWVRFANLVRGGTYGPASSRGVYPSGCDASVTITGNQAKVSFCPPQVEAYNPDGSPAELIAWTGGLTKVQQIPTSTTALNRLISAVNRSSRVAATHLSVDLALDPDSSYVYAIAAVYRNQAGAEVVSNAEADGTPFAGLVGGSFTTGDIDLTATDVTAAAVAASTSGSGAAGEFRNTKGTDARVRAATGSHPLVIEAGSSLSEIVRIESSGTMRTEGEVFADDLSASSDARLKSELLRIGDAMARLRSLTGYTFAKTGRESRAAGLIAQDVQRVLPEAVDDSGEYLALSPAAVLALVVEALKELEGKIDGSPR